MVGHFGTPGNGVTVYIYTVLHHLIKAQNAPFFIFLPGVTTPLLEGSRARPEAAARSPGASPGAQGTGEDGSAATLDASRLATLARGVWDAFPHNPLAAGASPWPRRGALDLDLVFDLLLICC